MISYNVPSVECSNKLHFGKSLFIIIIIVIIIIINIIIIIINSH